MSLTIRPATAADASQILAFITELAIYERAGHEVKASEEDIQRSLFADNAPAKALMCLYDDKPIGYAVYFLQLLHLAGSQRRVPGRPVHHARTTQRLCWMQIVATHRSRSGSQRLWPSGMECAGLERTRHQILRSHRRSAAG